MRSGPTSRGSSYRTGRPVDTPGPSTSNSTPAQRSANASYSRTSCGTEEQRTIPSSVPRSTNARSITASSSAVCAGSVPTRNCSERRSPSKRPKTVCVLPASTASSRGLEIVVFVQAVAQPLGELVCGELGLVALALQLLDGHVGRGIDLDPRDHPPGPVLVPHPDVLHLHVEERIRRLRHVLEVELVAEIRRVLRQDAEAEQRVDRAVLLLEPELQLRFEVVELVEVAHGFDCSPRMRASRLPCPGTKSPASRADSGSRTKSRSARRGWGTVKPGSSTTSSP